MEDLRICIQIRCLINIHTKWCDSIATPTIRHFGKRQTFSEIQNLNQNRKNDANK